MRMLPVFEEIEAHGGEGFPSVSARETAGQLNPELRGPLGRYLLDCPTLVVSGNITDPLDDSEHAVVPFGLSTDGQWVWHTFWGYFVQEHGVAVPADFVEHARAVEFTPAELSDAELERAEAEYEAAFPARAQ